MLAIRRIIPILGALLLAAPLVSSWSQAQNRKIYLLHANTLSADKKIDPDRQTLRGEVRFRQDSCYMYCDSAYFYQTTNSMAAFGNVRMEQGDTLYVYCDSLFYDGNTMFGELYDNVHLIHRSKTSDTNLYTDYMTYDREVEEANYPETGVMIDSLVHLRSQIGWYYPQRREAFFQWDVEGRVYERTPQWESLGGMPSHSYSPDDKVLKPAYWLYSDTLRYTLDDHMATVLGPSRILSDTATIRTRYGTFCTDSKQANLYRRSSIESPGRFAIADTLYYDARQHIGEAWGRLIAIDSIDHAQVHGDYGYYIDNDSVPQMGFVTGHALAMEYSGADTLYLHADTLRAFTVLVPVEADTITHTVRDTLAVPALDTLAIVAHDSLTVVTHDSLSVATPDSLAPAPIAPPVIETRVVIDSIKPAHTDTLRFMQAYYGVRYYRRDMQGVCDSLIYLAKDSLAKFIGNPVMWNNQYQITGDTIFAIVTRQGIQRAMIHPNAFLTQSHDESLTVNPDTLNERQRQRLRLDSLHYDQINGTNLVCLFDSGRVSRMDMDGNVKIIYYPEESDHTMIGLNQMIGNYLTVWFKNQRMDKLKLWPQVEGSLTPIQLVSDDILYLPGFRWMAYLRPKDPLDVFRGIEMKEEDKVEIEHFFNEDELNGWQ